MEQQFGSIRAHPALAGMLIVSKTLTAESTNEQNKAGLMDRTPEEFARIQQPNADYNARFGFPVHPGREAARAARADEEEIIDTPARRLEPP